MTITIKKASTFYQESNSCTLNNKVSKHIHSFICTRFIYEETQNIISYIVGVFFAADLKPEDRESDNIVNGKKQIVHLLNSQ